MLALFLAVVPLASQGAITCKEGGHTDACQVRLNPGQNTAVIRFRPVVPIPPDAWPVTFQVWGSPDIPPDPVQATANSPAVLTWARSTPLTDTARIYVQTEASGVRMTDTIYVLPPLAKMDHVEAPYYFPYIWLQGSWMPLTIRVPVTAIDSTAMTEARCERVRFHFQPWGGGMVQPDTGAATWVPAEKKCLAETRWKLGDATGSQQLRLVLGDGERVERNDQMVRAYAREGPRVVAGVGFFTRHNTKAARYCESIEEADSDCVAHPAGADTVSRDVIITRPNAGEPFFGVEFPVFFSNQPGSEFTRLLYQRLRLMVGSTFDEPKENVFVGLTVIPVIAPAYERIPVQLQAGWRPKEGGFFIGGSIDGTEVISGALKALGVP